MRLVLRLLLFLLLPVASFAACTGSSPNLAAPTWDDVATCHAIALDGDTITVAAGTYSVTAPTVITKYVKIVADGVVILIDNSCPSSCFSDTSQSMLQITESPAGSTTFSGFVINQGAAVHSQPSGVILLSYAANGKPVLVTNNTYNYQASSGDFIIAQVNRGVISGNTVNGVPSGPGCLDNNSFVRHKWLLAVGSSVWASPAHYGMDDANGDQALYIETNTVTNVLDAVDSDDNARTVIRYNTWTNSSTPSHGADTSVIGMRSMEIYGNTYIRDMTFLASCGGEPVNLNGFIALRGGTALIHDNVIPDINDGWWGDKPEVIFLDEQLRRNAGQFACWAGGYPSPHQVGWGFSTGATNPGGTGYFQDLEPVYLWNNAGAGNYNAPSIQDFPENQCPNPDTALNYIVNGREYIIGPKPGYAPYTYPHPLLSGIVAAPPPPPPPPPPVNTPPPPPNTAP